jgi:hypothetical protein
MTRRHVHCARASVHRDKIGREHDRFAIKKRMSRDYVIDLATGNDSLGSPTGSDFVLAQIAKRAFCEQ